MSDSHTLRASPGQQIVYVESICIVISVVARVTVRVVGLRVGIPGIEILIDLFHETVQVFRNGPIFSSLRLTASCDLDRIILLSSGCFPAHFSHCFQLYGTVQTRPQKISETARH